MKKILTLIISFIAMPCLASAASFTIAPTTGSYVVGDTIVLNFSVDPEGSPVYTAMLDAQFSPSVFQVVSFSLNDNIMALRQAGYDTLDNTKGVLIKTGGYPGGIESPTSFGKLVLRVRGAGVGVVTVRDDSKILDSSNRDLQKGTQAVSFTIAESKKPAINEPISTDLTPIVNVVSPNKEQIEKATSTTTGVINSNRLNPATQLANVVNLIVTNWVLYSVLLLVIFFIVYQYVMSKRKPVELESQKNTQKIPEIK